MKLKIAALIISVALLITIGWTVNAQKQDSPKATKVTWEYKIEFNPSESKLNELGAQGWEMTGVFVNSTDGNSGSAVTYFKKAK
jgi:hypothetical protein